MKPRYYPPPLTYIGGAGPHVPRKMNPALLAVPEDNPPFAGTRAVVAMALVVGLWQPAAPTPQPRRFVPQDVVVAADAPVFASRSSLYTIVRSWDVAASRAQAPTKTAATAEPEFVPGPRPWLSVVLQSWQRDPWRLEPRKLNPTLEAVPEDAPPVRSRGWLSTVLQSWQLAPVPVLRHATVPQDAAPAVVDNPPFGMWRAWLPGILRAWQPGPPRPPVVAKLPPVVLAVAVNNPPFGQRLWMTTVLRAWQPPPPLPTMLTVGAAPFVVPAVPEELLGDKLRSMSRVPGRALSVYLINRGQTRFAPFAIPSGQIQFPAVANPSTNPYTLDDYREGDASWTPIDTSGAALPLTVVASDCCHTKIGREVTAAGAWTYPVTADVSPADIGGLPFPVTPSTSVSVFIGSSRTNAGVAFDVYALRNSSRLQFVDRSNVQITNAQLSGAFVRVTIRYFTDV